MEFLWYIFVVIVIVEAIIEAVTMLIERFDPKMAISGLLGMAFAYIFGLDLFAYLQVDIQFDIAWLYEALNVLILGFVFVRYSGNLNDILEWLKGLRPEA